MRERVVTASLETTVRDATVALLRSFGMKTIFGNPGSTELPMFRDFPSDFRYVLGLQESIVVGMADGFAQATRNAAFVNLHSSAGVGHALGNIFTAFRNQTPLVITAGQQARSILPFQPFLFAEEASAFPKPFVKWSVEPARAQDVPDAIAHAYYCAMQPPCGPVFVSVPVDDWDRPCHPVAPRKIGRTVAGDPVLLAEVAQALADAANPTIVAGAGIARDNAWDQLIVLAERHQARVWVAPFSARNCFPEDHPLFAGFLPAARDGIVAQLKGHDLILVVGGPLSLYHVEGSGPHAPDGASVIQLVDNPAQATAAPVGTAIVTSAGPALATLNAGPAPRSQRHPPRRRDPAPLLSGARLSDAYLLQRIAATRSNGSVIVEEAPSSRPAMHDYLPILERDTFYTCASGGLGHGLPAAIGISLGRPGDRVIAFLGDGSSMYAIQGLWTAGQLGLPITFIIANNGRYEALDQFGRHFDLDTVVGTKLPCIDFVALARAQGISGERIDHADALDAGLRRAFSAVGPTLVDVIID
jgi:benzoylformate decarboxylase